MLRASDLMCCECSSVAYVPRVLRSGVRMFGCGRVGFVCGGEYVCAGGGGGCVCVGGGGRV